MKNRVAVLHGINLGALDRRPAEHYGGLTLHAARAADRALRARARARAALLPVQLRGRVRRGAAQGARLRRRADAQPGRVDALRVVDARRARDLRAAGGRGAPLRRRRPRGVPARVGARGRVHRARRRARGSTATATRSRMLKEAFTHEPGRPRRRAPGEKDVDALLVTDRPNLRYLTGFTGSNGFAVVGRDVRRFVTDFRYVEQAAHEVLDFDREQGPQDFVAALRAAGRRASWLGFDDDHVSVRAAPAAARGAPGPDRARAARRARGGRARGQGAGRGRADRAPPRRWSTRSTTGCASTGIVGRTEREVAVALEHEMRLRGASEPSFPSIVASGRARRAAARARRATTTIARGTLVTIDIGAVLDGYCSDCTRTWATGELARRAGRDLRARRCARRSRRWTPCGRGRTGARSTPSRAT